MTMLVVRDLEARYGRLRAVRNLSLQVDEGEIAVVLGANGAGKTTLLRAISGMVNRRGSIVVDGVDVTRCSIERVARLGVAHVPQGRGTFAQFTVDENLRLGAWTRSSSGVHADMQTWYEFFPTLAARRKHHAGHLSGGEQQMLAVARALMSRPKILLLDEPSLGLSPIVTAELFGGLRAINRDRGTTMLVVEQNASLAFDIARSAYLLEAGELVTSGSVDEFASDESLRRAYLGY